MNTDVIENRNDSQQCSVVMLDGWGSTMRGPDPEPIFTMRNILNLNGKVDDDYFLRYCLSINAGGCDPLDRPRAYLYQVADHFGVGKVPERAVRELEKLIRVERNGLSIFADVNEGLRKVMDWGFQLGLCTNSWEFPIDTVLDSSGLNDFFKGHVIVSALMECAKQEGSRFYRLAADSFGVAPNRCYMVGDDPHLDIFPALEAGMRPILIDRKERHLGYDGVFKTVEMEQMAELGIPVIRTLNDLLDTIISDQVQQETAF